MYYFFLISCQIISYSSVFLALIWIAKELLMGICMSDQKLAGKVVVITGATSGVGKATALDLAKRGATLIMTGRTKFKTTEAAKFISKESNNDAVYPMCLDLASQKDVRRFAAEVKEKFPKIHYLINNAGMVGGNILATYEGIDTEVLRRITEDGLELVMATNYFGHVTLTELLLENLKRAAEDSKERCRIIHVSSEGHRVSDLNSDLDFNMRKCKYNGSTQYFNSKMAQIWYSNELARKLKKSNLESVSLHPGAVRTNIFGTNSELVSAAVTALFYLVGKNPWQGAQTTIYCVVSDKKLNGKYLQDCRQPIFPRTKIGDKELERKCYKSTKLLLSLV